MNSWISSKKKEDKIVVENQSLVRYIVKRIVPNSNEWDDMVSIGTIGLIKAVRTFDCSRNIHFATYASQCIQNEIYMYMRKNGKHAYDVSLDEPVNIDKNGNVITLGNVIPSSDIAVCDCIEERETFSTIFNAILNVLTPRERFIILYKIGGFTQNDIGKILNLTQSYISRIITKCSKKLKSYLLNPRPFEKVYLFDIVNDLYQITFLPKDFNRFNEVFLCLLNSSPFASGLPYFNIYYDHGKTILQLPSYDKSFILIAQILQRMDGCNIKGSINTSTGQKTRDITQSQEIREYILTLDEFSCKHITSHFPDYSDSLVRSIIIELAQKGLITRTVRNKYSVNKT